MRKVEVVPHNPCWQQEFQRESKLVATAFGNNFSAIHHIGSTSISNIHAKPIIDMLVEVIDIEEVDKSNAEIVGLGYEPMGEFGISGRRYFRKEINHIRTHHIHAFQISSPDVARHLDFRDYMIAHPEDARQYSQLKQELAKQFPHDIESYMDGKDAFIKEMQIKANNWKKSLG